MAERKNREAMRKTGKLMVLALLVLAFAEVRAGGMLLAWPSGAPKKHPTPLTHKSSQISVKMADQFATTEGTHFFQIQSIPG